MKYEFAALAFAVGALAGEYYGGIVYTTDVVTGYTTYVRIPSFLAEEDLSLLL
jgi:hypothetical protein